MFQPHTPTKAIKADEDINSRIQSLSIPWNLQLPVRDASWSPSRNPVNSEEKQIYERVRWLYFKNERALAYAIADFEKHARSNWVSKPHADPDVLPTRSVRPSTRQNTFLKKRNISEEDGAELRKVLLDILKTITDKVKARVPYEDGNASQEADSLDSVQRAQKADKTFSVQSNKQDKSDSLERNIKLEVFNPPPLPVQHETSSMTKLPKQQNISDFFRPKYPPARPVLRKETPLKEQQPSSDDYPIGEADLLDLVSTDAPLNPNTEHSGLADDMYMAPRGKNTLLGETRENEPVFRMPHPVPTQRRGLKRSCPEAMLPSMSRNVSREKRSSGYSRSHSANEIEAELPMPGLQDGSRSSATSELTRSFSGTSVASMASSRTHLSSGFNTPFTSFNTDSLTTSFNSANDSDPTITLMNRQELPSKSNATVRSTSEPPSSSMLEARDQETTENIDEYLTEIESGQPANNSTRTVQRAISRINFMEAEDYLQHNLVKRSPFAHFEVDETPSVPFRQVYEVMRVATACNLLISNFSKLMKQGIDDYGQLWTALSLIAKKHNATMPERSSTVAWKRAEISYDCIRLSGGLKFSERPNEPLLKFQLKPLKLELSYRLVRKFGGDRFCVITMPGMEPNDLPKHTKDSHNIVREALIEWLASTDHHFLGRKWRAFYIKPESSKSSVRKGQKKPTRHGYRIFFFAEDGQNFFKEAGMGEPDPRKLIHRPMTIAKLIDWFMPSKYNGDQTVLKFYARLALAVSSTKPTIQFKPGEIIRCDDAYAHNPGQRRLNLKRSDEKKSGLYRMKPENLKVMNDGCARLSRRAAKDIAEMLGLDHVPSVFQGRIGGAKGMWMIDALDESLPRNDPGRWIEITDSQLKFEGDPIDNLYPDPERVTFEVQSYSRKLSTAALNFQLMPILEDRGVPYTVFKRLLEEDLTAKVGELEVAMDSALALRKWNQDNNSVTEERLTNKGIEMVGGIPDSLAEKINWFVEHGFEPKSCCVLKDLLYSAIMDYCTRLENRMNIELGRSTYAFMIADPLALLEENEVHIGFSSMFRDTKSEWSEVMLHNMDILVSRLPALLPSDIQKVRAVFKPELGIYRDVIIFPSKGSCPLADKLSGGDYDGDMAWICWEPSIVEPFENAPMPEPVDLKDFGIIKDELKVSDISDFSNQGLRHAFEFNLRANMLGPCTAYHEAMCYHDTPISDKFAVAIAGLLGALVDRPKAGFIFGEPQWTAYKKKYKLKSYPKPAYKDRGSTKEKDHLIDNLVFVVAKSVREDALGKFAKHFQKVGTEDDDLVRPWVIENEESRRDSDLKMVLYDLKNKLGTIRDFWKANVQGLDDNADPTIRRGSAMSFRALVEKCRADFLAIEPLAIEGNLVTKRWKNERSRSSGTGYWDLLKASAVYHECHKSGKYAWWIAGVELGELKATAAGKGTYRIVTEDVFEALKLDNKVVKRRQEMEYGSLMQEEEDEFGDFDWDDIDV